MLVSPVRKSVLDQFGNTTYLGVLRPGVENDAVANGLHAGEHDVKPHGIRRNRTFSAANAAGARRVRSSRAENREVFQKKSLPDGPRRPPLTLGPLAAAGAPAPGSGTIVGDDVPCPSRSPDTAARHATASIAAPHGYRLRYSSVPKNEAGKTIARTPSRDKSADGNGMGLAAPAHRNHAG